MVTWTLRVEYSSTVMEVPLYVGQMSKPYGVGLVNLRSGLGYEMVGSSPNG